MLSPVAVDVGPSPDITALSGGATGCPHCLSPGCGVQGGCGSSQSFKRN